MPRYEREPALIGVAGLGDEPSSSELAQFQQAQFNVAAAAAAGSQPSQMDIATIATFQRSYGTPSDSKVGTDGSTSGTGPSGKDVFNFATSAFGALANVAASVAPVAIQASRKNYQPIFGTQPLTGTAAPQAAGMSTAAKAGLAAVAAGAVYFLFFRKKRKR